MTKREFKKTLREIADYSAQRNMMAHDAFHPDPSKQGVEFLTVKAKGKFDLPNIVWSVEKFQTEGEIVDRYRDFLNVLEARFRAKPLDQKNYTAALQPFLSQDLSQWPMRRTMAPVLIDFLSRQPQEPPDSSPPPSSGQTKPQTPEEPRE